MKLKALIALPLIALMAACSSGGGGGGNSTPTPAPVPASESIADLASFAASGTKGVNDRGIATASRSYEKNGKDQTVVLQGSQKVGLLTSGESGSITAKRTLIGADKNARDVSSTGYYVGDASGSLRMKSGQKTEAVSGTASVGMDAATGKWGFGADLWRDDGQSGIYVGADNGTVDGNTMVFKGADSVVVDLSPNGTTRTEERAGSTMVFSDDAKNVFGKITGKNDTTGFSLDAGFAGKEYQE